MTKTVKHCQRHNRPEGWVLPTKVTSLAKEQASSYTNLDQISFSSRASINFKISTKHQLLLASESRPRLNFITPTRHRQQNAGQTSTSNPDQTLCSKSEQKLKLSSTRFSSSSSATVTTSTRFKLASSHALDATIKSVSEWVSEKGSQWSESGSIVNSLVGEASDPFRKGPPYEILVFLTSFIFITVSCRSRH